MILQLSLVVLIDINPKSNLKVQSFFSFQFFQFSERGESFLELWFKSSTRIPYLDLDLSIETNNNSNNNINNPIIFFALINTKLIYSLCYLN